MTELSAEPAFLALEPVSENAAQEPRFHIRRRTHLWLKIAVLWTDPSVAFAPEWALLNI